MNFLFKVLVAAKASSNHHKIPLDIVKHMNFNGSEDWQNLFLKHWKVFLTGTRDPDRKFHDFRNHVLHVNENYWGGAIKAATKWYRTCVDNLKAEKWEDAIYSAGVMSHYFIDPFMPFHTGQTEEEGIYHKYVEWGVLKTFSTIQGIIENKLGGYPDITLSDKDDWIDIEIKKHATLSNKYYNSLIDNYDIKNGKKKPGEGMTDKLLHDMAEIVSRTVIAGAKFFERAIMEAGVSPPRINMTIPTLLASINIPIFWIVKNIEDKAEKKFLLAQAKEYEQTGKVIKNLAEDDKEVRKLHAEEILKITVEELNNRPLNKRHKTNNRTETAKNNKSTDKSTRTKSANKKTRGKSRIKFHLELTDKVGDAPEIGGKTEERLNKVGIITISDLLNADPAKIAKDLNHSRIDTDDVLRWQKQTMLAQRIPNIRGHDVQILVRSNIDTVEKICSFDADKLLEEIDPFVKSSTGKSILRSGAVPDLEEVTDWIEWAKQAR